MTAAFLSQYKNATAGYFGSSSVKDFAATPMEGYRAAYNLMRLEGQSISRQRLLRPLLSERESQLREYYGGDLPFRQHFIPPDRGLDRRYEDALDLVTSGRVDFDTLEVNESSTVIAKDEEAAQILRAMPIGLVESLLMVERARRENPDIPSDADLVARMIEEQRPVREELQEVMGRAPGGAVFFGNMAGVMMDPLVLGSLPFGATAGVGRGFIANFMRIGAIEAGITTSVELAIQSEVYQFKKELGSPYTFADAALNVLAAGAGGFILGGLIGAGVGRFRQFRAATQDARLRQQLIDEGYDPRMLDAAADSLLTAENLRPRGLSTDDYSAAMRIADGALARGEPLTGLSLPITRAVRDQADDVLATGAVQRRIAELDEAAQQALSRTERTALKNELGDIRRRLAEVESEDGIKRLVREAEEELNAQGKKSQSGATMATRRQREIADSLRQRIDDLEARLKADDFQRKSRAEASRLRTRLEKAERPTKVAEQQKIMPNLERDLDMLQQGIREAMTGRFAPRPMAARSTDDLIVAVRDVFPESAPRKAAAKPRVDKGIPLEEQAPALARGVDDPVDGALGDIVVTVYDANGNPVQRTARQLVEEVDESIQSLDRLVTCLRR